jgi:hypothetical protein
VNHRRFNPQAKAASTWWNLFFLFFNPWDAFVLLLCCRKEERKGKEIDNRKADFGDENPKSETLKGKRFSFFLLVNRSRLNS